MSFRRVTAHASLASVICGSLAFVLSKDRNTGTRFQAAKKRFAKFGQTVSGEAGSPDGSASIFNKNGT